MTTITTPGAIVIDDTAETSVLSRWDALANQIAEAGELDAKQPNWDYRNKHDQRAARSWIAQLRKLNARIEASRKEAKAIHLERGRAVDSTAKVLAESVAGLIERHAEPIAAIEAEEAARVRRHQAVLQQIESLSRAQVTTGAFTATATTAAEARDCLATLQAIDITTLEEFQEIAAGAFRNATAELEARIADLETREAEAAELAALRAAAAQREQQEREERIRQEAIEAERRTAQAERLAREVEAERQRIQAEEQANKEREAAAAREAQSLAAAAAARQAEQEAKRREQEARAAAEAAQQAEVQRQREDARRRQQEAKARQELMEEFTNQILRKIDSMDHRQIAAAIATDTLDDALRVNWSLVFPF